MLDFKLSQLQRQLFDSTVRNMRGEKNKQRPNESEPIHYMGFVPSPPPGTDALEGALFTIEVHTPEFDGVSNSRYDPDTPL